MLSDHQWLCPHIQLSVASLQLIPVAQQEQEQQPTALVDVAVNFWFSFFFNPRPEEHVCPESAAESDRYSSSPYHLARCMRRVQEEDGGTGLLHVSSSCDTMEIPLLALTNLA